MTGPKRTITTSADETLALARAIGELLQPGDVVILAGDLGAGKTVFVRGIAAALGAKGPVVSPTFTIVREYEGRCPLTHVDVYRIENLQELHDLGFEEIVRDDAITVVEWGDVIAALLPRERLEVRIELADGSADDDRVVEVCAHGPSWFSRGRALDAAVDGSSRAGSG